MIEHVYRIVVVSLSLAFYWTLVVGIHWIFQLVRHYG